jgi:hypothetical protein
VIQQCDGNLLYDDDDVINRDEIEKSLFILNFKCLSDWLSFIIMQKKIKIEMLQRFPSLSFHPIFHTFLSREREENFYVTELISNATHPHES